MAEEIQPFAYTETTAAKERELIRQKLNEVIEAVNGINPASDAKITIKQGGTEKGSFTLDQTEDKTIELESGGGGSATFESLGGEPRDNEKLALELTTLEDAIEDETEEREDEITALWNGVNTEAATRQTQDEALALLINENSGDIAALQADLTQEISDREAADDALDDAKEDKLPNAAAAGMFLKSTNTTGGKEWVTGVRTITEITDQLTTIANLLTVLHNLNIGDQIIGYEITVNHVVNIKFERFVITKLDTEGHFSVSGYAVYNSKYLKIAYINEMASTIQAALLNESGEITTIAPLQITYGITPSRIRKITY